MEEKIFLPAGVPARAVHQPDPNPRRRILVVDGEPPVRRLNGEALFYAGYHVDAAEDGVAAWDALLVNNYDLLVTDNDLPKVSGVDLIKRVHATRMALPVIMAAKKLPTWEFAQYPWLQPAAVLFKPYSFEALVETVKKVLQTTARVRTETAPPPKLQGVPVPRKLRIEFHA